VHTKKFWRVKRRHRCHSIGLDFHLSENSEVHPEKKKRTVKPGDAFENIALERGFETAKS
jgi:hypothetical protein